MSRKQVVHRRNGETWIQLSRGVWTVIGTADWDAVRSYTWFVNDQRRNFYAYANHKKPDGSRTTVKLHRLIAGVGGLDVDHVDGNGLNNRRSNLRACSRSKNSRNQVVNRDTSSGIKGVSFNKRLSKWHSYIKLDGKRIHLGFFESKDEAAAFRRAAELKHDPEFFRAA